MPSTTPLSTHSGTGLRPKLSTTYGGRDPVLLERMLPYVEAIEVTPDAIAEYRNGQAVLHGPTVKELQNIDSCVAIIVHGVGLSIGSHEGWSSQYLSLLDDLLEKVEVAWHSEHLGYTTVDGEHLGTMLALPKTEQMLDLICERVSALQQRYGLPFLLENVVHLLPDYPGDYSDASFLNTVCQRTGCGQILDIYNLECDAFNYAFDVPAFLDELDLSTVREMHLAGGVEHKGFKLDVHSNPVADSTVALAQEVLSRPGHEVRAVTYELLREAVPVLGHDAIVNELARLRRLFVSNNMAQA